MGVDKVNTICMKENAMFVLRPAYKQLTLEEYMVNNSQKDAEAIVNSKSVCFYRRVTKVLLEHSELFEPMYPKLGRPAVPPAVILAAEIYARDMR